MFQRGLNDGEIAQLVAAGFMPALATAVAREALTMRWLFLRRGHSGFWATAASLLVAAGAFVASLRFGGLGWLIGLAVSAFPVVQYAPDLEAWSLKRSEPARYAARKLAIMAVIAQRTWSVEPSKQAQKLQELADGLDLLAHPHTQLRLLARALDDESASKRETRKAVASSDGMRAALLFGVAALAVVVIILTLALGARPF